MSNSGEDRASVRATGIKDIAQALGVSIGTVDRALHHRPGINSITRARVLKMAQTLGYRPNVAARHLKLNRKLVISVHLPREIASFFDFVRDGIAEAAAPFASSVELQFRTYPRLGEGDTELLTQAVADKVNGIILAPGAPAHLKSPIRKAAHNHVPVVCVATDAPGTARLSSVSSDSYTGGAMAAELLTRFSRRSGAILVVTGDLSTLDHSEKLRGLREFLSQVNGILTPGPVVQAHDDAEQGCRLTAQALAENPEISAVYVSTANSLPVIRALEETGRLADTTVITTDLFPGLAPLIREGKVLATLYQRPRAQGRIAFRSIYQFLVEGTCPPVRRRLPPHIILRSNLDLFLDIQKSEADHAP